jgi:CrcB protein
MSLAEIFNPFIVLGIFVAGGLGSVLRVSLSKLNGFWPWGILLANVVASFFAGWAVTFFEADVTWVAILVVGLAGGLSTYSAFVATTGEYLRSRLLRKAALNALGVLVLSSTAFGLGQLIGLAMLK